MKKVVLLAAFAVAALAANAQVLKNEFLKDYKPGQQLERVLTKRRTPRFRKTLGWVLSMHSRLQELKDLK